MIPMRFPAIALLLILARFTELIESGTVASEIPDLNSVTDNTELAQWPPKSISDSGNQWHNGERIRWHNDHRITTLTLALYQRNTWHNITEMGGTMGSELSTLKREKAVSDTMGRGDYSFIEELNISNLGIKKGRTPDVFQSSFKG